MQLPQYHKGKNVKKNKLKVCQECGQEYFGHAISKYCKVHQDAKLRKRKKKIFEDPNIKNQTFKHSFYEATNAEFPCQVPGCKKMFIIKLYPKQDIYPEYCPEHRNEFKRNEFIRRHKGKE